MTAVPVAPVSAADRADAARLLHAMERHYEGAGAAPETRAAEALDAVLLAGRPWLGMLLARSGATAVGFVTFSVLFPAEDFRPGLFVKDLFVDEPWRRAGVGAALLGALAREALRRGCARVDWVAARDNAAACALYERVGAARRDGAVLFRLDAGAIARLAAGDGTA
jgi:GNAT superfamily N-acetyltransferase